VNEDLLVGDDDGTKTKEEEEDSIYSKNEIKLLLTIK
jgi:hypothetical protein